MVRIASGRASFNTAGMHASVLLLVLWSGCSYTFGKADRRQTTLYNGLGWDSGIAVASARMEAARRGERRPESYTHASCGLALLKLVTVACLLGAVVGSDASSESLIPAGIGSMLVLAAPNCTAQVGHDPLPIAVMPTAKPPISVPAVEPTAKEPLPP